ncbi:MAG: hypothetical protein KJ043_07245, partial [Anaerolineae bacterium]|nr:hypothetical protein [Anaerolineae bacterium]
SPTPTATITPTNTDTPIPTPVNTPFERRPLPATWSHTPSPTITVSPIPSNTPTITYTPSPTATRTEAELCEAFTGIIVYDPTVAYPRDAIFTMYAGVDDPAYIIIFEATERLSGEVVVHELDTNGLYQVGELLLETFPVIGTYDWVLYLQDEDGEQICPIRGEIMLRERTIFDYIPTATATP